MLDERASSLLKTLIEQYIADGHPVGSRALSRVAAQRTGLDLSPATIRNVMADLEELGLIASPHTSAGRVPTAKGYRFFVDRLVRMQPVAADQTDEIKHGIYSAEVANQPQKMLSAVAQMLSSLSHFAGVVAVPKRTQMFHQIEFIRLSAKRLLLIIVSPNGDIQNYVMAADREYTPTQLIEASNFFNQNYAGLSFDDVRISLRQELSRLRDDMLRLMTMALETGLQQQSDNAVLIAGEKNLWAMEGLADDRSSLRRLLDLFEQKSDLLKLLDLGSQAQGVQIFIGGESQYLPVEQLAVVSAPYTVEGQMVGTLGVIGPMRMEYQRVIPIVDITARLLSNALDQTH